MRNIQELFAEQLTSWPLAANNYAALQQVRTKELEVCGTRYQIQFNPARILSSAAKVDSHSIQARKCFLCPAHLQVEQQALSFKESYQIVLNPFPIFPKHFTVPTLEHVKQLIGERMGDMLDLATFAEEYVVFYNGPRCGASAPDHMHFQLGNKGFLPIEQQWEKLKGTHMATCGEAASWLLNDSPRTTLVIESTSKEDAVELFDKVYRAMEINPGEDEPMLNLLAWKDDNSHWIVCLFPREKHRPTCYAAEGEANILISPATVDMGGVFIIPRPEDFDKITAKDMATILSEVCLSPAKLAKLQKRIQQPQWTNP